MIRDGKLVALPTETVYGLGADAKKPAAVAGIYESKQRPHFDPLIVHVSDLAQAERQAAEFPEIARKLAERFWPGPLTLVVPKQDDIPDLVTAGMPTVGLRVPNHPLTQEVIRLSGCCIAAPSANPFGEISPTTAEHVINGLGGRIDAVLDGGPCEVGLESTIVSCAGEKPMVLRVGGLSIEEIEEVTGPIARATPDATKDDAAQPAPGMLSRHYAPRTPLILIAANSEATADKDRRTGLLTWGNYLESGDFERITRLSSEEDLRTCATRFFAAMRDLDAADLDVIIARRFPDHGLGIALNDRLQRAASGREPQ